MTTVVAISFFSRFSFIVPYLFFDFNKIVTLPYDFPQEDPVSRQAFSKARANLNPEYVRKFADGIAEIHAQNSDAPTYAGMRLIAIDGTDIALENSPAKRRKPCRRLRRGRRRAHLRTR